MTNIKYLVCVCLVLFAVQGSLLSFLDVDPRQCIMEKCPDDAARCLTDPKCEPALNECLGKCGRELNQSCWTVCLAGKGSLGAFPVAICAYNHNCLNYSIDRLEKLLSEKCNNDLVCLLNLKLALQQVHAFEENASPEIKKAVEKIEHEAEKFGKDNKIPLPFGGQ